MIRLVSLRQTSWGAPSQWEARTDEGRPAYIRYRHGELSVRVRPLGGLIDDAIDTTPIFDEEVGERLGSQLDWEEIVEATGIVLIEPA